MLQPLDGPSSQGVISVDTITVKEAKIGGSALIERKVITMQGDGKFYVYFGDGVSTPSAATVTSDGFVQFKNATQSWEAGELQKVYLIADSGTVNVRISERA